MVSDVFSVATESSTDTGVEKTNPFTVRIFEINTHKIETRFFEMCWQHVQPV